MSKYIIKLRPVTPYFFGGENTFGEHESQNYYAVSELLPQTSSIIGLMRFLILKNNLGLDCKDPKKITPEIGDCSFQLDKAEVQTFGKLRSVSPVFITDDEGSYYVKLPQDYLYTVAKLGDGTVGNSENEDIRVSHACKGMVEIKYCNGKSYSSKKFDNYEYWLKVIQKDDDVQCEKIKEDEIFVKDERIGINKADNMHEKRGFFKQSMNRFKGQQAFIFTAEVDEGGGKSLSQMNGDTVKLGASSLFVMEITEGDLEWKNIFASANKSYDKDTDKDTNASSLEKIVMLSDLYVPDFSELRKNCVYIWGASKPFRSVFTESKTPHSWSNHKKSALFRVMPAGTVLFFEKENRKNVEALIKGLVKEKEEKSEMQKKGINLFI